MKYMMFLILIGLVFPAGAWADTAYVHSSKADIYSKPAMNSTRTASLAKGDTVEIVGEQGSWSHIEFDGRQGFVYTFLLNKNPVTTSEKVYSRLRSFFSKIESVSGKSRRRPSSYTATAAARGLREKREHLAALYKSDYDSLEKFESIVISDDQARDFIRKGVSDEKNN